MSFAIYVLPGRRVYCDDDYCVLLYRRFSRKSACVSFMRLTSLFLQPTFFNTLCRSTRGPLRGDSVHLYSVMVIPAEYGFVGSFVGIAFCGDFIIRWFLCLFLGIASAGIPSIGIWVGMWGICDRDVFSGDVFSGVRYFYRFCRMSECIAFVVASEILSIKLLLRLRADAFELALLRFT